MCLCAPRNLKEVEVRIFMFLGENLVLNIIAI